MNVSSARATERPPVVFHVVTVPLGLGAFLAGHIRHQLDNGLEVQAVCAADPSAAVVAARLKVPLNTASLTRRITPWMDLRAVVELVVLFRRHRPVLVHAHTPKAGLIGMIAASLARVPVRFYTVHGLVHLARSGWRRPLLMATERISCTLAHRVLCVSPSIRRVLIQENLCPASKCGVIGSGSIAGVDAGQFSRSPEVIASAAQIARRLDIQHGDPVIGFVGRLTRDKGLMELTEAWQRVSRGYPRAHLLLVGPFEVEDEVPHAVRQRLECDARVHVTGWQEDVAPWMATMTLLVLPTYREGFGLSLIEAAAMELPSVATKIPGCMDAVQEGITGLLVPPRDAQALADAIELLLGDAGLRQRLGHAGRRLVLERFDPQRIHREMLQEYTLQVQRRAPRRWPGALLESDGKRRPCEKMRVLHIVKTAIGATWVYHLVRVLCSLGIEIVVALPSDTEGLAPMYRDTGATVVRADVDFPMHRIWRLPSVLSRCRGIVAQAQPDIIHTHHVGTTYVTRLALGKSSPIPRVFQVAGPLHLEHCFFSRADIALAGPNDSWIATCHWTRREYLRLGIPENRILQTFAGTDIKQFRSQPTGKLRRQLSLSPDVPLIGMVAHMYAPKYYIGQTRGLKGHEDFIAAFRIVQRKVPEARAVIIGGPWNNAAGYERRLHRLGARLCGDHLQFVGHRSDVSEIYPDLSLAVVPSLSENLGGAVEPLLSGVPVVATSVGGLPDIIHDGETGWLVPPKDPLALAAAMLDALRDPAEARRRTVNGNQLACQIMDAERTSGAILGFYKQILALSRRKGVEMEPLR